MGVKGGFDPWRLLAVVVRYSATYMGLYHTRALLAGAVALNLTS